MTIAGAAASALVAIWLVATAAMNLPGSDRLLRRSSSSSRLYSLIPKWAFFAPRPVTHDVTLLYRDRMTGGGRALSAWSVAINVPRRNLLFQMVWNPSSRSSKAVSDASNMLIASIHQSNATPDDKSLMVSVPYLILLNRVCAFARPPDAEARQFVLAQHTDADDDLVLIFASGFHRFE